jgi:hypothetical protein
LTSEEGGLGVVRDGRVETKKEVHWERSATRYMWTQLRKVEQSALDGKHTISILEPNGRLWARRRCVKASTRRIRLRWRRNSRRRDDGLLALFEEGFEGEFGRFGLVLGVIDCWRRKGEVEAGVISELWSGWHSRGGGG